MHHPTDRLAHTSAFVTPVVEHWLEREIAQWVHPMKDRSDDPSHHERTLLPQSYISLPNDETRVLHLTILLRSSPTDRRSGGRVSRVSARPGRRRRSSPRTCLPAPPPATPRTSLYSASAPLCTIRT